MMYSDELESSSYVEGSRVVIFSTLQCKIALLIYAYTQKGAGQTNSYAA